MLVIPYPTKNKGMGKATYLFWLEDVIVVHVTEYVPAGPPNTYYGHEQNRVFAFDRTTGRKLTVHQSWNIKGLQFVLTKPEGKVALLDLSSYTLREIQAGWLNTPRYALPVFHSEIYNADDANNSPQAKTDTVQTTINPVYETTPSECEGEEPVTTHCGDTVTVNTTTFALGEPYLKATAVHPDNTTVAVAGNNCLYLIDVD